MTGTPKTMRDALERPLLSPRNIRNFWRKVDRGAADECWPWTGAKSSDGFGAFTVDGVMYEATHIALVLDGRPRPRGALALHGDCKLPACVNGAHLRWGTELQNAADRERLALRRMPKGEAHAGAKLDEAMVTMIRTSKQTGRELAAMLSVSTATISLVRNRRIWTHLP